MVVQGVYYRSTAAARADPFGTRGRDVHDGRGHAHGAGARLRDATVGAGLRRSTSGSCRPRSASSCGHICAIGRLPIAASTSLLYLVPPVAVLMAWLWLGEVPLPAEVLGGAVVVAGVVVVTQGPRLRARLRSWTAAGAAT